MHTERKRALLEELWRDRMHTDPEAIERAPRAAQQILQSIWEPARRMRASLADLPEGLLSLWIESQRGHLVFTHLPSRYAPGLQPWQQSELDGVCTLSVGDIAQHPYAAFAALGDLIDHLLGSAGEAEGPWFADGGGVTPELRMLAERFGRLHSLGYAVPDDSESPPRSYFSHTWALYMTNHTELETLDPLAYRLFRYALMAPSWWKDGRGGDMEV